MFISGDVVLRETEPDLPPVWACVLGCCAFVLLLRIAGYLVLRFIKNPRKQGMK